MVNQEKTTGLSDGERKDCRGGSKKTNEKKKKASAIQNPSPAHWDSCRKNNMGGPIGHEGGKKRASEGAG